MSYFLPGRCANAGYQELNTPKGKIVSGLDADDALKQYGYPDSINNDIWHYAKPKDLFVYLPHSQRISLYPEFCDTAIGSPIELKVFAERTSFQITDVTRDAEFIINEPSKFILRDPGILIPQAVGRYQIIARYNDTYSNTAYLTVRGARDKNQEKLLSIDILPYKPKVPFHSPLYFFAYGTFMDSSGRYLIKDLTGDVVWFTQAGDDSVSTDTNVIEFSEEGRYKVFCKYKELKSSSQDVEVIQGLVFSKVRALKNITLLPEFISIAPGQRIIVRAFGTYDDNSVEDIAKKVNWRIKDKKVINLENDRSFLIKGEGITDISAELDQIESLATKINAFKKTDILASGNPKEPELEDRPKLDNLLIDIESNISRSKDNLYKPESELFDIKIEPGYLELDLGETKKLTAFGRYSDNSRQDLTLSGDWKSSAEKIASVFMGKLLSVSNGQAKVYMEYKGIKSLPADIVVKDAKLVSIIVSPSSLKLSMKAKGTVRAEGFYSNEFRKDITSLVHWNIVNEAVVQIRDNYIIPKSFGKTQVDAEYLDVKSLPVDVEINISLDWIIWVVLRVFYLIIIIALLAFSVLYFITLARTNNLILMQNEDPRMFIASIYKNMRDILFLFGMKYDKFTPPRSYALLVEKKYHIENSLFFKFTLQFEEAEYSRHILQSAQALEAVESYNDFMKVTLKSHNKFNVLFVYLRSLIRRAPIFIPSRP